jgi:hypothetical protein
MSSSSASSAAAPAAAATPWRHYVHLLMESAAGPVVVPTVITVHADDAPQLSAALPAVLDDLLFILRLHARRILPGGGGGGGGAAGDAGAAVAVYHGHLVSATFTLRDAEAIFAVLTGVGAGAGAEWTNVPVAAFQLCAALRHKASERRRRKERLLTSPTKLDAFLLGGSGGRP